MRSRARRGDGGSAVVEMVALLPLYVMFIIAVVFVGKLNNSSANIDAAARSAARTISISRNPQEAVGDAEAMARSIAEDGSPFCQPMSFPPPEIDLVNLEVTVTVTCVVDLAEATFIGMPGTRTLTATATEVIDQYREGP